LNSIQTCHEDFILAEQMTLSQKIFKVYQIYIHLIIPAIVAVIYENALTSSILLIIFHLPFLVCSAGFIKIFETKHKITNLK